MSNICYLGPGSWEFNMPNGTHMDVHEICDLTFVDFVHLLKCRLNLGPRALNMLQAPGCLIRHCLEF